MQSPASSSLFPRHIWTLLGLYCVASLAHFIHNAEYIAFYPNMPAWLTREKVYLAWQAVASVGVVGIAFSLAGWRTAAALCLVAYGALGLDGLGHYALALCSQHTFAMNFTIWFEVLAGVALAVCSASLVGEQIVRGRRNTGA
ncbi:MAG TPA: hypothetical protein VEC35_25205 [Noviherbaspirillum sp.]|nr:hypothetical protein [Noviherbaspirillum sp.]